MPLNKLLEKAERVINLCVNKEQIESAEQYAYLMVRYIRNSQGATVALYWMHYLRNRITDKTNSMKGVQTNDLQ